LDTKRTKGEKIKVDELIVAEKKRTELTYLREKKNQIKDEIMKGGGKIYRRSENGKKSPLDSIGS
jgi:hypothetical protein